MNWYITIAGLIGAFTVIGHFAMGSKQFLKPMLSGCIRRLGVMV